jgi:hypothetical protein
MGSSSEYAAGPGSPAAPEESGGDEPEVPEPASGFAELRRETAAMLKTLADKYDAESEDSRTRSARLLAESKAAGALATKLGEESVRIRAEADRLGAEPDWMTGLSDVATESSEEPAKASGATTTAPGPGPARGFAPNVGAAAGASQSSHTSEPDDWAPRPFESWRNQATPVTPRRLEI